MPHIRGHSQIKWHYEMDGEGELLMFIHGWGVDKRIWRQQTKYFSQYYKVMTIDLPGHGKSSWEKVSLAQMAEDVSVILRRLKIDQVSIIGSSIGGLLALKLYERDPNKIRRLIFVGSMPKFARSDGYPYGLDVKQMRKLGRQLETAYPLIINIFFRSLFTKQERASRRFKWLQKFRQTDEPPMKNALMEYLDILEEEDLREILVQVNRPLQFINGADDEICCRETIQYLKDARPGSRFDLFDQCGHFPFLSKPHEFNQVLNDFLFETR